MLKVYDNFVWRDFMSARVALNISPGSSFQPQFLANVQEYSDIVDSYARALPDDEIYGDAEAAGKRFREAEDVAIFDGRIDTPVEILFIDGAKCPGAASVT